MNKLKNIIFLIPLMFVFNATAQSSMLEEVVVTAQKKEETLQDVPLQVQTLTEESLEASGINTFEDYLLQLPGVTAGGSGLIHLQ